MSMKVQTYVCRLKKDRVLTVTDTKCASGSTLARIGQALCKDLPHEQIWLVMFGSDGSVKGALRIGEGGISACAIRPADILRPVLVAAAPSFALVHNHPSGDPTPSAADRDMTRLVLEAAQLLGLTLLDHVVVTRDSYRSLRDYMAWC